MSYKITVLYTGDIYCKYCDIVLDSNNSSRGASRSINNSDWFLCDECDDLATELAIV
jgi:hypothetical protein